MIADGSLPKFDQTPKRYNLNAQILTHYGIALIYSL